MNNHLTENSTRLTNLAGLSLEMQQQARRADDQAWIEVIQHMDEIYADLVKYQVDLEEKNSALENAQKFIQSILSSMSDLLIVCDINGNIQQVNQALVCCLGFECSNLEGKSLSYIFSDKHAPMIADFPEHIRSGSIIDCEVDLINMKKQTVPMAINCSARFDHKNRISGMVITGRPLGELRTAYAELQQAHEELQTTQTQLIQSEKMASLGRLVAGVAHELNNPISFLFANMHVMKSYQHKLKTYLAAIHQQESTNKIKSLREKLNIDHLLFDMEPLVSGSMEGAERVSDIVKNLQKFTTPQKQKMQSFNILKVIERASSWVMTAAQTKPQLILNFQKSETALMINNNEGHIHQILINLFQNAIDALGHTTEPEISVNITQDKSHINIHVMDNGHGIKPEDISKIFDPFFTTKAVGSGTGLGLYISYGLATEQCQGDLIVQNNTEQGCEFILRLPMEVSI